MKNHAGNFKRYKKKVDESLIPQNIEAEEAVLGAILVNPETLAKISDTLTATSFTNLRTDIFMKQCCSCLITMTQ